MHKAIDHCWDSHCKEGYEESLCRLKSFYSKVSERHCQEAGQHHQQIVHVNVSLVSFDREVQEAVIEDTHRPYA